MPEGLFAPRPRTGGKTRGKDVTDMRFRRAAIAGFRVDETNMNRVKLIVEILSGFFCAFGGLCLAQSFHKGDKTLFFSVFHDFVERFPAFLRFLLLPSAHGLTQSLLYYGTGQGQRRNAEETSILSESSSRRLRAERASFRSNHTVFPFPSGLLPIIPPSFRRIGRYGIRYGIFPAFRVFQFLRIRLRAEQWPFSLRAA